MSSCQSWNANELAEKYQDKFGISISTFLNESEIQLRREEETGIWKFSGCAPGDGPFYESLSELPYYYMTDKWEFDEAIRMLSDQPRDIRILEVGCGSGAFLDRLRDAGFKNIHGLELNEAAKSQCCEKGHSVRSEMTESLVERGESFDYVFAFQVLEHVPDPQQFIRELACLASENGQVILTTPNKAAFPKRYQWDLLDLPPHHMSRWDDESYATVSKTLQIDLTEIKYEPLAKYHYKFFTSSFLEQYQPRSLRRRLAKIVIRTCFSLYPRKNKIRGHSMMAIFGGRKSHAAEGKTQAAA